MIDGIATWFCLLAAGPGRQRVNFETEWTIVGSLATILAVFALLSYWLSKRQQKEFLYDSSSRLFQELCRAHRLDLANRRLMKKLASAQGVDNAPDLFVEPDYFDATNLPSALKSSASELRQLRHELFE